MADSGNIYHQMISARQAYETGMTHATRHCTWDANSCQFCRDRDHETISIYSVMNAAAMHKYCQCKFTYSRIYQQYIPVPPDPEPPDVYEDLIIVPVEPPPDVYESYESYELLIVPVGAPGLPAFPVETPLEDILKDLFPEDEEIVEQEGPKSTWTCCTYNYAPYNS